MVVHRQVPVGVVAHHVAGMHLGRAASLVHVGLDKAAVLVLQLVVDRAATVRGILRFGQLRHRQLVHTETEPVVLRELPAVIVVDVRHPRLQPVQLRTPARQPQISEHVIERAVLHHQDDDVIHPSQRVYRGIDLNLHAPCVRGSGIKPPLLQAAEPPRAYQLHAQQPGSPLPSARRAGRNLPARLFPLSLVVSGGPFCCSSTTRSAH